MPGLHGARRNQSRSNPTEAVSILAKSGLEGEEDSHSWRISCLTKNGREICRFMRSGLCRMSSTMRDTGNRGNTGKECQGKKARVKSGCRTCK